MEEHLELAQKAMAVLNQIQIAYGDPEDVSVMREKTVQIRAVGKKLFEAGGADLMQTVIEAMRIVRTKGETDLVNREIDIAWRGIGDWS